MEVDLTTEKGIFRAAVPSGASTGKRSDTIPSLIGSVTMSINRKYKFSKIFLK